MYILTILYYKHDLSTIHILYIFIYIVLAYE